MVLLVKLCLLGLLWGCSPSSTGEFRVEGGTQMGLLLRDLKKIETLEQLVLAEPVLCTRFEELADVMIAARAYQSDHPEEEWPEVDEAGLQALLKEELKRVYGIEGGREIVERAQQEALIRLDAHERVLAKRADSSKGS